MSYNSTCPYCDSDNEFDFDEWFCDGEVMEVECDECNKVFWVRWNVTYDVYDEWEKMDCKNGLPCDFDWTKHYGDHSTRYCCTCWKEEVPRPNKPYPIPKEEQYYYYNQK